MTHVVARQFRRIDDSLREDTPDPVRQHDAFRGGDSARAAALYESAMALVERERDPVFFATLQSNLGTALVNTGELERALKLHSEALRIFSA